MNKLTSGGLGEVYAARYLRDREYDIVGANYHCRHGEIDIIAQKDGYIIFVEVKTRAKNAIVTGAEAVNFGKRQKIISTAMTYISGRKVELQPRFEVIEVVIKSSTDFEIERINHIINAFDTEGFNASF